VWTSSSLLAPVTNLTACSPEVCAWRLEEIGQEIGVAPEDLLLCCSGVAWRTGARRELAPPVGSCDDRRCLKGLRTALPNQTCKATVFAHACDSLSYRFHLQATAGFRTIPGRGLFNGFRAVCSIFCGSKAGALEVKLLSWSTLSPVHGGFSRALFLAVCMAVDGILVEGCGLACEVWLSTCLTDRYTDSDPQICVTFA